VRPEGVRLLDVRAGRQVEEEVMKRACSIGFGLLLLGLAVRAAAPPGAVPKPAPAAGPPAVAVVGIEVAKALGGDEGLQALSGRRIGTRLTLRITHPRKFFLALAGSDCELTSFTDDKLIDLVASSTRALGTWRDGPMWVSSDGHTCLLDIFTPRTPASSASHVLLKATLVLKCGLEPAVANQTRLVLAAGQKLSAGPVPMKIASVRREGELALVSFTSPDSPERIGEMAFFEIGGKEVESRCVERNVIDFMGSAVHELTMALKTSAPAVGVRVRYFRRTEKLPVGVDVKAGVGL